MHSPRQASFDRSVFGPVADGDRHWLNQLSHAHDNVVPFQDDTGQRPEPAPAAQEAPPRVAVRGEAAWPDLSKVSYAQIRRRAQATRAAYLTALVKRIAGSFRPVPDRALVPTPHGLLGRMTSAGALVWQRPEVFGCIALVGLFLGMVGGTTLGPQGAGQCRTEPGALAFGADIDATMTVSHSSVCAIWTKADNASFDEPKVMLLPQHGTIALRGRTGVTYRPNREFTGEDSFAFTLRGRSAMRDIASLVRVRVNVK
jgi:hypothetical protein